MIYGEFASVYDALMDDIDYDAWSVHYLKLVSERLGRLPKSMIECACGTGNLTVRFAKNLPVLGVDASLSMLQTAEKKARQYGVDIRFIRQDMRRLQVGKKAEAVLCTCDGINYLTSPDDVRAFFRSANRSLVQGGVLAFDISSRFKLEEEMGNSFFGEERDGIALLWKNTLLGESHIVVMDVTCFIREDDGRYRRIRETHRQRAHSVREITELLEEDGFGEIQAFGEMRFDRPLDTDRRIHIVSRKR